MNKPKYPLTPREVCSRLTQAEKDSLVSYALFIAAEDVRAAGSPVQTARRMSDALAAWKKIYKQHSA